jgi:hypothetical protein
MAGTIPRRSIRTPAARAALGLAAMLTALAPGAGWARTGVAAPRTTRAADDIPLPPDPPRAPAAAPQPGGGCTKEQAGAKAAQLLALLESLIQRDPQRARGLLDEFDAAVKRYEQHQADLGEECRAYDALIARAAG